MNFKMLVVTFAMAGVARAEIPPSAWQVTVSSFALTNGDGSGNGPNGAVALSKGFDSANIALEAQFLLMRSRSGEGVAGGLLGVNGYYNLENSVFKIGYYSGNVGGEVYGPGVSFDFVTTQKSTLGVQALLLSQLPGASGYTNPCRIFAVRLGKIL